ncbi:MAG TPA: hypothetical protein PLT31_00335 [Fibrobacteraceae bacterium]|jgi:hypothetical protein|nr:hypothetical protein [Fibrobacter sp.]HPW93610.1 hypothetical protein [Fibrobacteraceae bacterium]
MMNRLLLLFVILLSFSCSKPEDPISGGPGSETTNGIVAQIFDSKGKPASKAGVALRRVDFSPDSASIFKDAIMPDEYTDSLGFITIDSILDGSYRITIEQDGEMLSREIDFKDSLDLGKVHLRKTGSFNGSIALPTKHKFGWVGIYGLDILVKTDSLGNFSLPELPASDDSMSLYIRSDSFDDTLREKTIFIEPETEVNEFKGIVLQDFDKTSYDYWYITPDTVGAVLKSPSSFSEGIVYDDTRKSNVFHASYEMGLGWSWVVIGTSIEHGPLNFSQLDSISFWAKGNGLIRVQLENWTVLSELEGSNLKTYTPYKLLTEDTWEHIVIKPENFCEINDVYTKCDSWETTKGSVQQIHFFLNSGTDIYLDDITLYGIRF